MRMPGLFPPLLAVLVVPMLLCILYSNLFLFFYFFVLRWKDSMYHALGYSSILVMQATMTFEQKDIQAAMATIKEALQTCQR